MNFCELDIVEATGYSYNIIQNLYELVNLLSRKKNLLNIFTFLKM